MELKNTVVLYSSEKCEILLGEGNDGRMYIRKNKGLTSDVAELLKKVDSPYIVRLVEYGEDYTIHEYADGSPLSETGLPAGKFYDISLELCDGVSALHEVGLIHRDIKPSNIILCSDGHVKLIDFDAARVVKPAADKDTSFMGTDGFAPPEQFGFSQTNRSSDIYSLGVTMKVLLGENYQRSRYRRIIEKCTQFDPGRRYQSVVALKRALVHSRFSAALISGGVAVCAAVGVAVFALNFTNQPGIPVVSADESSTVNSPSEQSATAEETSSAKTTVPTEETTISTAQAIVQTDEATSVPTLETAAPTEEVSTVEEAVPTIQTTASATTNTTKKPQETTTATTTTTPTEHEEPVILTEEPVIATEEIPPVDETIVSADFTVPAESVRNFKWETLPLPEGFPKLTEAVSYFEASRTTLDICWDISSPEEADYIASLITEWYGRKMYKKEFGKTFYDWIDPDALSIFLTYDEDEYVYAQNHLSLSMYTNATVESFYRKRSAVTEYTVPEDSSRDIPWEELPLPDGFPKLADGVSDFSDDTLKLTEYVYTLYWDKLSFEEACFISDILCGWAGEENYKVEFSDMSCTWSAGGGDTNFWLYRREDDRDVGYQAELTISKSK